MSDELDPLRRLERAIAAALRAPDPAAALAARGREAGGGSPLAAWIAGVEPEGLRIAALLVARLRFERLLQGSPLASRWFEADPADFARAFRRYHAEVPATAHFPQGEAELFAAWSRAADQRA